MSSSRATNNRSDCVGVASYGMVKGVDTLQGSRHNTMESSLYVLWSRPSVEQMADTRATTVVALTLKASSPTIGAASSGAMLPVVRDEVGAVDEVSVDTAQASWLGYFAEHMVCTCWMSHRLKGERPQGPPQRQWFVVRRCEARPCQWRHRGWRRG